MKIQEALKHLQEGALIRRPSWEPRWQGNAPHQKSHLVLSVEKASSETLQRRPVVDGQLIHRDSLPPSFDWEYFLSIEDALATDWELLEQVCSCAECSPVSYQDDPLKMGDLIEYFPCSGFRIIWKIDEMTDTAAAGNVHRLFDCDEEMAFTIVPSTKNKNWPTVKIEKSTVYQNWIGSASCYADYAKILNGPPHHWPPRFGQQCRVKGENLAQLNAKSPIAPKKKAKKPPKKSSKKKTKK